MSARAPLILLALALAAGLACLALARDPAASADEIASPSRTDAGASARPELELEPAADRNAAPTSGADVELAESARAPAPSSSRAQIAVRGRCLDEDGRAIADVTCAVMSVTFVDAAGARLTAGDESQPYDVSRSGADGRFEHALVAPEGARVEALRFRASLRGRIAVDARPEVRGLGSADLGDLVLLSSATLAGVVREVSGRPVADATVVVSELYGPRAWRNTGSWARTDESGAFRIEDAPTGALRLHASATDSRASEGYEVTTEPREKRDGIVLLLPEYESAGSVTGIVLGLEGKPVARAPIRWAGRIDGANKSMGSTQARDDGRFRLSGGGSTTLDISASHPDGRARGARLAGVPVGTHGIEMRLTPTLPIPLRVLAEDGTPVRRYSYALLVDVGMHTQRGNLVRADATAPGGVTLDAPVDPFRVEVMEFGYETHTTGVLSPDALPPELEIVLRALPTLRGRVVRDGVPVAGATVSTRAVPRRGRSHTADVFDLVVAPCTPCMQMVTGDDGRFVLSVDAAGSWRVLVSAPREPTTLSPPREVHYGGTPVELVIDLAPRGSIEGRVLDARGVAVDGRVVTASCGDGETVEATSDAEGRYRLEPLAPGGWQVRALDPRRPTQFQRGSRESDGDAPPIAWDCRVSDGSVTRHDVTVPGG